MRTFRFSECMHLIIEETPCKDLEEFLWTLPWARRMDLRLSLSMLGKTTSLPQPLLRENRDFYLTPGDMARKSNVKEN